uniref:Cyclic nucleotide-gated calmodulin-binding ion channel-like n=1 Tax=Oryza sativa subsp. japonica TaxID=39947 RepID=Q6K4N3_ORYSJ|nr:cyclic nucleotide-gated calmodulin-binding ion channel-like [Oryza sativa Japonica Group]BAD19870.1 cyclic nucleotide-gated calmodulin-binding ion channel-like [Oryza sativa Japonica Group]
MRVFGRGDLITDPKEIAWQYLRSDFVVDAVAALPLPQILIWFVIPAIKYSTDEHNNNILVLIVLAQYFPRLYLIFPLTYEIVKTTGVVAKTAWQGAAYNMLLYMIASHVCCYGQTITVSTYIGETLYCIFLAVLGLVLFAHLIGNVQTYLQSITVRVEEWRLKQRDTEEWMRHRQLPHELRERVRRFIQYKWLATRGVNEESILQALPADLRRDIKRHLCLGLVRRVPFFSQMDNQLLDAICERLVSSLCTQGTYIVREGDPVTEMLFIIRGKLESSTTNGGRTGFFNSTTLKSGDFCGEELLGWALVPKPTVNLPSSTRTVKALIEVEAFALQAEDLKFVANQFRRLHSKRLQHTFRYYSHHWRTWASCFIQAAWRRYKRRKMARDLSMRESFCSMRSDDSNGEDDSPPKQNLAMKIMSGSRKGPQNMKELPKLRKPDEPDFSAEPCE